MPNVNRLEPEDRLTRQCLEARRQVGEMFDSYRERYIDTWCPRPCPTREEYP